MIYEWVQAFAYEIEAVGARHTPGAVADTASRWSAGLEWLGGTRAGRGVGEQVRRVAALIAELPAVTWQADLVRVRHGLDELTTRLPDQSRPLLDRGLDRVQVLEALEGARRDRLAVRSATLLLNPVAGTVSAVVRTAGRLGDASELVPRLSAAAVAAGRSLAADTGTTASDGRRADVHLLLARAHVAGARPNRGLQHAWQSAALARSAADDVPRAERGAMPASRRLARRASARYRSDGLAAATRAAMGDVTRRDYENLDPRDAAEREVGHALYVAARAHLQRGEFEKAREAADATVRRGNSLGWEVHAAALDPTPTSVAERSRMLRRVEPRDRRHHYGVARGDITTATSLSRSQVAKVANLLDRIS